MVFLSSFNVRFLAGKKFPSQGLQLRQQGPENELNLVKGKKLELGQILSVHLFKILLRIDVSLNEKVLSCPLYNLVIHICHIHHIKDIVPKKTLGKSSRS